MRTLPFALAASLLILSPAASGLRADPPAAPVPAAPAKSAPKEMVVSVSLRFVKASARAARSLRLLGTARRPGDVPTYDPAALARRLQCWERAGHVTALAAPQIAARPGQRATITVGEQISYIQDYEVELESMDSWVANPVLGTVFEGLSADCTGTLVRGGVLLAAEVAIAELKRPIEVFESTLQHPFIPQRQLRIQLPELRVRKSERRLRLSPGRAALLADMPPLPSDPAGRVVLVWAEARAVEDPGIDTIEAQVAEGVR